VKLGDKGKGRVKAREKQVVEEEIDELVSDSEGTGTISDLDRGKGKGKAWRRIPLATVRRYKDDVPPLHPHLPSCTVCIHLQMI
jgi:hypothetical protein